VLVLPFSAQTTATPTPTYGISHSRSTLLLIDSLQFIQGGFSEQFYYREMEQNLDFNDVQTQKCGPKRKCYLLLL
jgi:hypothetical protein